jgi:hypothetical protein
VDNVENLSTSAVDKWGLCEKLVNGFRTSNIAAILHVDNVENLSTSAVDKWGLCEKLVKKLSTT